MSEDKRDPLDELIVDVNVKADSRLLAGILKDYIRITRTGEVLFENAFDKEKEWKKVMLFLLAKKVIALKKLDKDLVEETRPKDISEKTFVSSGTVRRSLKRELKNIVAKSGRGSYKIPNFNLRKCKLLIHSSKDIQDDGNQKLKRNK
jgi:hypothetical protein